MITASITITWLTIALYITAALLQWLKLKDFKIQRAFLLLCASAAIMFHAYLLHQWIDVGSMQNLSFANIISQVAWFIALLVLLFTFFRLRAFYFSGILIYPFAALTILLEILVPGTFFLQTAAHPKELFHIILAFICLGVLILTYVQAILLALQEYFLKKNYFSPLIRALPALETMENILFYMLVISFLLLTSVLISAFCFFPTSFGKPPWQHIAISLMTWLILAGNIISRVFFSIRGKQATRWLLITLGTLLMIYWILKLI